MEARTARAEENERQAKRVFPAKVGEMAKEMLLARRDRAAPARPPRSGEFAAGKTGTTENYGDAWFVGGNDE